MLKQLNVFTVNTVAYTTSREIENDQIVIQCVMVGSVWIILCQWN